MPASSKAQQRFFGVVKAMQKGDKPKEGEAGKVAKSMKKKDVDKYAKTKHKGLPNKVKREMKVRNLIKKMVREELNKMNEVKDSYVVWSPLLNKVYDGPVSEKEALKLIKKYAKQGQYHVGMLGTKYFNKTKLGKKNPVKEGTCGYGENGQIGEEPAGPHLIKKKKIKEKKLNEAKPYETILKQLGGNRFIAMTGAKNLGTNGKDLSFSIGRNAKKVTHVHIKLTSMDLYDVEFINMRGAKRKVIKKVKGVYGDMLPKIFQKYTGMRTRL